MNIGVYAVIPEGFIGNLVSNHIPDRSPPMKSFEGKIRGLPPHGSSGG
jgi:hypothetical protein